MPRQLKLLYGFLALALITRIALMIGTPLMDTSEPRYANIARVMAETGDWITPWFDTGIPFWGKPPLAFWSQALSFRIFGYSEFAVRFPSLLATLGVMALIFNLTRHLSDRLTAILALVIYSTTALGYVAAGAVLTDPFLTLSTTLVLMAMLRVSAHHSLFCQYGIFVALAIGFLAKGPLILVLCGGPVFLWILISPEARARLLALPWISGALLTMALTLPWYVAAEIKTPGFLNYFIVGEHFRRFVDPGWGGDLYGSSHEEPHGMIWWQAVQATFPWGILALGLLLARARILPVMDRSWWASSKGLLCLWALWPMVFFTFAGNILWTYVQPALPAFAILLAHALGQSLCAANATKWQRLALIAPIGGLLYMLVLWAQPNTAKTEKELVAWVEGQPNASAAKLVYVGRAPFSARYYSGDRVESVRPAELSQLLGNPDRPSVYLAMRKEEWQKRAPDDIATTPPLRENRRYVLLYFKSRKEMESVAHHNEERAVSEWQKEIPEKRAY